MAFRVGARLCVLSAPVHHDSPSIMIPAALRHLCGHSLARGPIESFAAQAGGQASQKKSMLTKTDSGLA
jgi:hypothetical protein